MESTILHGFSLNVPGVKPKTIYHFSDTHIAVCDDTSSLADLERAQKANAAWERVRADFARVYGEPCAPAQIIPPEEHFTRLLDAARGGDALVLTGDIADYISDANINYIEKALSGFPKRLVAVCGNHERRELLPASFPGGAAKAVNCTDLGDMLLIGVDDSALEITPEMNSELESLLAAGKPTMLAMHAPFITPESEAVLGRLDSYYILNRTGCSAENIGFIKMILAPESPVFAVLTGHTHFRYEFTAEGHTKVFIASQGILGNINRYDINGGSEAKGRNETAQANSQSN